MAELPPVWFSEIVHKSDRQGHTYRVVVNTPHMRDPDPITDGRCLYCGLAWDRHPAVVQQWAARVLEGYRGPGRIKVKDPKIADKRYLRGLRAREAAFDWQHQVGSNGTFPTIETDK